MVGQAQVVANVPGLTSLFVSNSNVASLPLDFVTCPVQSIALAVSGGGSNNINVTSGAAKTITATVLDTQGNTITGVPLTWSSSNPLTVGVSASGGVSTPKAGGGSVVASCTPPTCNIGLKPLLPIYPEGAVNVVVAPHHNQHNHAHRLRIEHWSFFFPGEQLRLGDRMHQPFDSY